MRHQYKQTELVNKRRYGLNVLNTPRSLITDSHIFTRPMDSKAAVNERATGKALEGADRQTDRQTHFPRIIVRLLLLLLSLKLVFHWPAFQKLVQIPLTETAAVNFYARKQNASRTLAIVWASVRLSVRPSHSWSVSKRCKLGSRNLHCGLPQGL